MSREIDPDQFKKCETGGLLAAKSCLQAQAFCRAGALFSGILRLENTRLPESPSEETPAYEEKKRPETLSTKWSTLEFPEQCWNLSLSRLNRHFQFLPRKDVFLSGQTFGTIDGPYYCESSVFSTPIRLPMAFRKVKFDSKFVFSGRVKRGVMEMGGIRI